MKHKFRNITYSRKPYKLKVSNRTIWEITLLNPLTGWVGETHLFPNARSAIRTLLLTSVLYGLKDPKVCA